VGFPGKNKTKEVLKKGRDGRSFGMEDDFEVVETAYISSLGRHAKLVRRVK